MSVQEGKAEKALEQDLESIFETIREGMRQMENTLEEDRERLKEETQSAIEDLENGNLALDRELEIAIRVMRDLSRGILILALEGYPVTREEENHLKDLEDRVSRLKDEMSEEEQKKVSQALGEINRRVEKAKEISQERHLEDFELN